MKKVCFLNNLQSGKLSQEEFSFNLKEGSQIVENLVIRAVVFFKINFIPMVYYYYELIFLSQICFSLRNI